MRTANLLLVIALVLAIGGTQQAQCAIRTWTGAIDGKWSETNNWSPVGKPISSDTLTWDVNVSTGNKISTNDIPSLSVAALCFTNAPQGIVLNGNSLTITSSQPFFSSSLTLGIATINMDLSLAATATMEGNSAILMNGVISGAATSLTTKKGNYIFNGVNTFSGRMVLGPAGDTATNIINTLTNSGVAQALGSGSLIQFGIGGASKANLIYAGKATSTDKGFQIGGTNYDGGTGGFFANGSGAVLWTGVQTRAATAYNPRVFTLGGFNTDDNTWAGAISNNNPGSINFIKEGTGKWILSGNNAFSNLTVNSGTLVLDYADNATVLNSLYGIPDLRSGTLELKGKATGATAQQLPNIALSASSGMFTIKLDKNNGDGVALTLGSVSGTSGSYLLLDLGAAGNSVTALTKMPGANVLRIFSKGSNGHVDYAANNGTNVAYGVGTEISNGIPTTVANLLASANSSSRYQLTNSLEVTSGGANLVRIDPSAPGQSLTINLTNTETNYLCGNILFVGTHDFTITQNANWKGAITRTGLASGDIGIGHFGTGKLTLNTKAGGDQYTSGSGAVDFFGTGLIDWTKRANSTGLVMVAGVTLRQSGSTGQFLDNTSSGLGSSRIALANGGILEVSDATTVTRNVGSGAGAIQWVGDGGFSAYGGDRSVNLGGSSATLSWGASGFVADYNALILCSPHSDSTVNFQNPLNLGCQQRLVHVNNGGATIDAKLSGVLSDLLGGGLVKEGSGTLELTAVNTYKGSTWVKAGELRVSGTTGTGVQGTPGGGLVTVFTNAAISGTGTVDRLTLNEGGKLAVYDTGSGVPSKLNVSGALDITAGTLDLSGLTGSLPAGDLVLAQGGSIVGTSFAHIIPGSVTRTVAIVTNTVVLKSSVPTGFVLMVH